MPGINIFLTGIEGKSLYGPQVYAGSVDNSPTETNPALLEIKE
jgi:hypothetical protein